MFQSLILDMDGLMVDTERLYWQTMREVAGRYHRQVPHEVLLKMMGRGPLESMRIFVQELGLPETPERILAAREDMMVEHFRRDLRPMPGLTQLLEYARGRFRLAVATGSPRKFMPEILGRLGIMDLFDAVETGDEVTRGKPDPEIYLKAAAKLAVPADECIVLEDSENGVRAAHAAGCYVIAVPSDYTRAQDFRQADAVVGDLLQAKEQIARLT
jgi:HAD superfamily hydrolase (TIGR01509 family)